MTTFDDAQKAAGPKQVQQAEGMATAHPIKDLLELMGQQRTDAAASRPGRGIAYDQLVPPDALNRTRRA